MNYKDGLALAAAAPVVRAWPLTPGIDFAGVVETSFHPDFSPGERVVLNGWGVGETATTGGFSQRARVKGDWLVKLPEAISNAHAMAIGTAGYTAMLAVLALERLGLSPEKGEVLVTGAGGGVGGVAIALLARLGYSVVASSGRKATESEYLATLGATQVIDRAELAAAGRPLQRERWAGAVDAVGSHTLANVLAQIRYGGAVAACGLAQGMDLPASVAPFILRGVTLAGIDSVMRPRADRERGLASARQRPGYDEGLDWMTVNATLDDVPALGAAIIAGEVRGRVLVDVNS